jgi:rhodanese-related sulfurtransferase
VTAQPPLPVQRASVEQLATLAPLEALSVERLRELTEHAILERVARGGDPLAAHKGSRRSVFLLRGEVLLVFEGGGTLVVVGGTGDGRLPLNRRATPVARARAISEAELIALDDELLDILVTFGQMPAEQTAAHVARSIFSLANLRNGVFARVPPARIEELLARFERVGAKRGDVLIREGEEGDYYYVIESGRCAVERRVGGVSVALAELKAGDAFGEEALASDARRNATVTLATDGMLLRLGKRDFKELLGEPLLKRVGFAEASERVARGARWLDVRYPSEYRYDRLPGALNVPLNEVRNSFPVLEPSREYIVYCQSGRRSSAAAFLFAQRGFQVCLLEGGLWAAGRGR